MVFSCNIFHLLNSIDFNWWSLINVVREFWWSVKRVLFTWKGDCCSADWIKKCTCMWNWNRLFEGFVDNKELCRMSTESKFRLKLFQRCKYTASSLIVVDCDWLGYLSRCCKFLFKFIIHTNDHWIQLRIKLWRFMVILLPKIGNKFSQIQD